MKKSLKFILSFFLILSLLIGAVCFPASSFENDIETSTSDILMVNLDTDTVVYSQKPDNKWYSGYLAMLMSYLVAYERIENPAEVTFEIEQAFIDELPFTDGCLDKYVGKTLTAEDLMAITLLTSGSDSAYALAYLTTGSKLSEFIELMNVKAAELGCADTGYISPGFSSSSDQYTTCRDVMKLYKAVRKTKFFNKVMKENHYTPSGMGDSYSVSSEASMLNSSSPYYFKYTNDAKFSYSAETYSALALTTTYHNMTYLFVGLLGLNESERNVYTDARKLTTWAYLNLSDRKVVNSDDELAEVFVKTGWGGYDLQLYSFSSAYKTLPNDYNEELLSYESQISESVTQPLIKGQKLGKASFTYAGEKIDEVDLVVDSDEGLDMLNDLGRFATFAVDCVIDGAPSAQGDK